MTHDTTMQFVHSAPPARRSLISGRKQQLYFRFRQLTGPLRMLPDFLIIGAQKCGTTSLYEYLVQHPSVGTSIEKEVRYFNNHFDKGVNWYKAHFPTRLRRFAAGSQGDGRFLTGEGEPSYLPNPVAPQRVKDLIPDVKLIVMLRDPVKRAYSHYMHRFVRDRESRTFEEVVATDKELLKHGWENLPTGDLIRLGHLHYSYLARGYYADQLQIWLSVFPREQFLIICAEDFFSGTQAIFDDVLEFLGLGPHVLEKADRRNVGKYTEPMSDELREDLREYFAPHNERLYEMVGRDFGWNG